RLPRGIHSLYAWLAAKMHNVQRPRAAARCATPELLAITNGAASMAARRLSQLVVPQAFVTRVDGSPRTRSLAAARWLRVPVMTTGYPCVRQMMSIISR